MGVDNRCVGLCLKHSPSGMTLRLLTADDTLVDCDFDEGNCLIVIDRKDYDRDDDFVALIDEDTGDEFAISDFEIVKRTRIKVLVRLEFDEMEDSSGDSSMDDEESESDSDEEYSSDDASTEFSFGEDSEESCSFYELPPPYQ